MSKTVWFLLGAGGGFLLARFLINPSDCCHTISRLASQKLAGVAGQGVADAADALGLTDLVPGILSALDYPGG